MCIVFIAKERICDLSHENVPCQICLNSHVRGNLMGDSRVVKLFSTEANDRTTGEIL